MTKVRRVGMTPITPAEDLRRQLHVVLQQTGGNPSQLLELIESILQVRAWERLNMSFSEFITLPYSQGGVGWSSVEVKAMLKLHHRYEESDPQIAERMSRLRQEVENLLIVPARSRGRKDKASESGDIVTLSSGTRGNSRVDTIARLKRDRPDLAAQVIEGKLTSHKAALLAGIRQRTLTFYPDDVQRTARLLRKNLAEDQLVLLISLLSSDE